MGTEFKKIEDIRTYEGGIPSGFDLVIVEEDNIIDNVYDDSDYSSCVLYGFDEIGQFDHEFKKPVYGFMKTN